MYCLHSGMPSLSSSLEHVRLLRTWLTFRDSGSGFPTVMDRLEKEPFGLESHQVFLRETERFFHVWRRVPLSTRRRLLEWALGVRDVRYHRRVRWLLGGMLLIWARERLEHGSPQTDLGDAALWRMVLDEAQFPGLLAETLRHPSPTRSALEDMLGFQYVRPTLMGAFLHWKALGPGGLGAYDLVRFLAFLPVSSLPALEGVEYPVLRYIWARLFRHGLREHEAVLLRWGYGGLLGSSWVDALYAEAGASEFERLLPSLFRYASTCTVFRYEEGSRGLRGVSREAVEQAHQTLPEPLWGHPAVEGLRAYLLDEGNQGGTPREDSWLAVSAEGREAVPVPQGFQDGRGWTWLPDAPLGRTLAGVLAVQHTWVRMLSGNTVGYAPMGAAIPLEDAVHASRLLLSWSLDQGYGRAYTPAMSSSSGNILEPDIRVPLTPPQWAWLMALTHPEGSPTFLDYLARTSSPHQTAFVMHFRAYLSTRFAIVWLPLLRWTLEPSERGSWEWWVRRVLAWLDHSLYVPARNTMPFARVVAAALTTLFLLPEDFQEGYAAALAERFTPSFARRLLEMRHFFLAYHALLLPVMNHEVHQRLLPPLRRTWPSRLKAMEFQMMQKDRPLSPAAQACIQGLYGLTEPAPSADTWSRAMSWVGERLHPFVAARTSYPPMPHHLVWPN